MRSTPSFSSRSSRSRPPCPTPLKTDPWILRRLSIACEETASTRVDSLSRFLDNEDARERTCAVLLLRVTPFASEETARGLLRRFEDPSAEVRVAAVGAFSEFAETVSVQLNSEPGATNLELPLLRQLGLDIEHAAVRRLGDSEEEVRETAVSTLADYLDQLQADATGSVNALLRAATSDDSSKVRLGAIAGVSVLRPKRRETVETLVALFKDPIVEVRESAADALGELKAETALSVPALCEALSDAHPNVRESAILSLAAFESAAAPAVDRLIELLEDPRPNTREWSIDTLAAIGAPAAAASSGLLALAKRDTSLRYAALRTAEIVGSPSSGRLKLVQDDLNELFANETDSFAGVDELMEPIASLGADGRPLIPSIVKKWNAEQSQNATEPLGFPIEGVSIGAIDALAAIGAQSEELAPVALDAWKEVQQEDEEGGYAGEYFSQVIRPVATIVGGTTFERRILTRLLKACVDRHEMVRRAATESLGELGHASSEVLATLRASTKDQNHEVRFAAIEALGKLGPDALVAAPELLPFLTKTIDPRAACAAARVLCQVGATDTATISALESAAKSDRPSLRREAKRALRRLRTSPPRDP